MRSKEALEFLGEKGVALIEKTLLDISNGVVPVEQSEIGISLARKLSKAEASINWRSFSEVIDRKVAAYYPNPIAFTIFRGEVLKITRSKVCNELSAELALETGELIVEKDRVLIGTGDHPLEIVQLIPQGKSEMKATDWARGARINPGELCG
jgi:methionyl-tRNA formyltransferase